MEKRSEGECERGGGESGEWGGRNGERRGECTEWENKGVVGEGEER